MTEEERFWRTQVLVTQRNPTGVFVRLPGRQGHTTFRLAYNKLPAFIRPFLQVGHRCHAHVNIGQIEDSKIVFKDWEVE